MKLTFLVTKIEVSLYNVNCVRVRKSATTKLYEKILFYVTNC